MEVKKTDIVFEYDLYIVDKNKILYKKEANNYAKIAEIKRHLFAMSQNKNATYFIDNYGDCYIVNEKCEFLYGILCKPMFWGIFNNDFITLDSYKRIWIYDIKGKLKNILFFKKKVKDVIINEKKFVVHLENDVTDKECSDVEIFNSNYVREQ